MNERSGERRETMSYLYDFFDNHMEAWGALLFGLLTVGACIAIAVALNGSM
jgi:hypothetical protein